MEERDVPPHGLDERSAVPYVALRSERTGNEETMSGVKDQSVADAELADSQNPVTAKKLSPAAKRALAEAEARRAETDRKTTDRPVEHSGRGGLDPVRYGDWEVKGIVSDF
jgi:hypothetical protein